MKRGFQASFHSGETSARIVLGEIPGFSELLKTMLHERIIRGLFRTWRIHRARMRCVFFATLLTTGSNKRSGRPRRIKRPQPIFVDKKSRIRHEARRKTKNLS
jgi:hypothetical protein